MSSSRLGATRWECCRCDRTMPPGFDPGSRSSWLCAVCCAPTPESTSVPMVDDIRHSPDDEGIEWGAACGVRPASPRVVWWIESMISPGWHAGEHDAVRSVVTIYLTATVPSGVYGPTVCRHCGSKAFDPVEHTIRRNGVDMSVERCRRCAADRVVVRG